VSRALNLDASIDLVRAACAKHQAGISSIETLPGGATRVVLMSADGAALIARAFKANIIAAPLARTPLSLKSRGVPLTQDQPRSSAFTPRA